MIARIAIVLALLASFVWVFDGRAILPASMLAPIQASATLAAASVAVMGWDYWLDFLRSSGENAAGWQTAPANTMSLWGVASRLLIGGAFARPAFVAPALARGSWALAALLLVAIATTVTWRDGGSDLVAERGVSPPVFAAWSALAAILGPLAWTHTAIWLLLPGALLLRQLRAASPAHATASQAVLLAALALLTIPRLSLFALAGPLPVAPWRGLALGIHLLGALVVFAVACTASARPPTSTKPEATSERPLSAMS